MIIKIKKIHIQNFKGISDLTIDFDCQNTSIFGDNATGKTTILDSFLWVLFDKNSQNLSNFSVKPLNDDGSEKHNLECKVEVVLDIDGNEKTFTRIMRENWTRKRGSTEEVFNGHTNDYFINRVKKTQKDFKKEIEELVDEEVFKMLTNLYYFNQNMNWKERREAILKLSGEIDHNEVIKQNPSLSPLSQILAKNKVEDVLKIAITNKQQVNKQLKEIPSRIEELKNIRYDELQNTSEEELKQKLDEQNEYLEKLIALQSQNDTKTAELELDRKILELENELIKLRTFKSEKQETLEHLIEEGKKLNSALKAKQFDIELLENKLKNAREALEENKSRREELYKEYDEVNAQTFTEDVCSYCGQALPVEKLNELNEQFNLKRAEKLDEIISIGKSVSKKIEELEKEIVLISEKILVEKQSLESINYLITTKRNEYTEVLKQEEVNPNQAKINEIESQIEELRKQKLELVSSNAYNAYTKDIESTKANIAELNKKLAMFTLKSKNDKRIQELETELRKLTREYEENENLQILCEQFITARASFIEDRVNDNFEIVKFKLFDQQINGGIIETCVATVNGVPYPDLNHAMQVNAGLDVIQGLQKVYGIKAPIFIDNAESVTKIKDIDTQIIKLIVSEKDKTLRIEKGE